MSNVVKFTFEQNNDKEIDINGELYNIPMDDESKDKYVIATKRFGRGATEISEMNTNLLDLSDEEVKALTVKQRKLMSDLIESVLGEGSFKKMYALAGQSVNNLMPLAQELLRLISDVDADQFEEIQNKYLQNGKK